MAGVIPVIARGDKESRAYAVTGQLEAGNVYLPGAPNHDHTDYDPAATPRWVQELVEELVTFPKGRHDDQVDALTQALRYTASYHGATRVSVPTGMIRIPTSTDYGLRTSLTDRWS